MSLSFSACMGDSVWNYLTGNFGGFTEMPSGTGSGANSNITINVGTAQTQTGGLSDVISRSTPTVVELWTLYSFEMNGKTYYSEACGSGVIVKKDNDKAYIVTNTQLILDGADQGQYTYKGMRITVRFSFGVEAEARILLRDETCDVGLVYVDKSEIEEYFDQVKATTLSTDIVEGEKVFSIGNPFMDGTMGLSASAGVISATARQMNIGNNRYVDLIQTDTAVNGGNTGGGLFDMDGKLVGVVNGKIVATGVEGLGFALPTDKLLEVLHQNGQLLDLTV